MTSVTPPAWSDDELLWELGAALQEPPVDVGFIRTAQAVFAWRAVEADAPTAGLPWPPPGEYVN